MYFFSHQIKNIYFIINLNKSSFSLSCIRYR